MLAPLECALRRARARRASASFVLLLTACAEHPPAVAPPPPISAPRALASASLVGAGDDRTAKDRALDANHAPASLTAAQWRADLRYLAEQMPRRHKNLFHTTTPKAFHDAVDALDAGIPHLNDDEITLGLCAIAKLARDSHSGFLSYPPGGLFPLRLRRYDDGLYVESAPPQFASAVGGRLVRIGSASAESVYEKLEPMMPQDPGNPGLLEVIGPVLMTSGHVLHGLGVEPAADRATFVIDKGRELTLEFTPSDSVPLDGNPSTAAFQHAPRPGWVDARGTGTPPLWLMHPDREFWSTYLPSERLFYVQFNMVQDAKEQTIEQFFGQVFGEVAKLPVDKLVLDLRMNNGGNNALLKPIIVGVIRAKEIDRPGHLFVITGRNTYSAAQNLVNRLEAYTNAIFVGTPTGENVNSYGDPDVFVLPSSHLQVGMATVWWQDVSERDRRVETDPEIAAVPTFADYVANRDPALDEIIRYKSEPTLEDALVGAVEAHGAAGGLAAYERYRSDPRHRFMRDRMETRINSLGYKLRAQRRVGVAVSVFLVNAEANPGSANAADSLGEAYVASGDLPRAAESFRRALQIDPKLESSRVGLANLTRKP